MRDKCNSCYYAHLVNVGAGGEMMLACEYILQTFQKRPCKPGAECSVYRPKGRRRGGSPA